MPRWVRIFSIDGLYENVSPKPSRCGSCGMEIEHPREYHPFAACLMFKGGGHPDQVRANLVSVAFFVSDVKEQERASE